MAYPPRASRGGSPDGTRSSSHVSRRCCCRRRRASGRSLWRGGNPLRPGASGASGGSGLAGCAWRGRRGWRQGCGRGGGTVADRRAGEGSHRREAGRRREGGREGGREGIVQVGGLDRANHRERWSRRRLVDQARCAVRGYAPRDSAHAEPTGAPEGEEQR